MSRGLCSDWTNCVSPLLNRRCCREIFSCQLLLQQNSTSTIFSLSVVQCGLNELARLSSQVVGVGAKSCRVQGASRKPAAEPFAGVGNRRRLFSFLVCFEIRFQRGWLSSSGCNGSLTVLIPGMAVLYTPTQCIPLRSVKLLLPSKDWVEDYLAAAREVPLHYRPSSPSSAVWGRIKSSSSLSWLALGITVILRASSHPQCSTSSERTWYSTSLGQSSLELSTAASALSHIVLVSVPLELSNGQRLLFIKPINGLNLPEVPSAPVSTPPGETIVSGTALILLLLEQAGKQGVQLFTDCQLYTQGCF